MIQLIAGRLTQPAEHPHHSLSRMKPHAGCQTAQAINTQPAGLRFNGSSTLQLPGDELVLLGLLTILMACRIATRQLSSVL